MCNFTWNGKVDWTCTKLKWDVMTLSICHGGLGIIDLKALLMKLVVWGLLSSEEPWKDLLQKRTNKSKNLKGRVAMWYHYTSIGCLVHLNYVRFISLSRISYLTHGDDINSSNVNQVALGRFFNNNFHLATSKSFFWIHILHFLLMFKLGRP